MSEAVNDGVRIAYEVLGGGEPLLCVHGLGYDRRGWGPGGLLYVTGHDRQAVGQVAAHIRALRPPDPYKTKGVRYTGEVLRKKAGKTGAGGK